VAQDSPQAKDFFISYTSSDKSWAEWIAWQLDEAGYAVTLQAWDFHAGSNFISRMNTAVGAKRTVAVYSRAYFQSTYCEDEWTSAFRKRALIPVRIEECGIPDLLKTLVYIDLYGLSEAAAKERLLAQVQQKTGKPAVPPAFPTSAAESKRFPGIPPAIFEVPHPRNSNFTGRSQMLEDLHGALTSVHSAAVTQAISGLGGVGKTSLALEYSYRFATDYNLIWWLRAEEPGTLALDYSRLAQALGLEEKDSPNQPKVISAVRHWLTHNSGWLLVFDNAVREEDLREYLPPSASGHILITSRNPIWGGTAGLIQVQKLAREESVQFLLQRTRRDEHGAAEELSQLLGDLPLALLHAAYYVDAKSISIADYVSRLKSHPKKLLQPVKATWQLSFDKLQAECPKAIDLLSIAAFLAPDRIPRNLLRAEGMDELEFDEVIEALRRYGLADATDRFLSVHRLLQQVIREDLDEGRERRCSEKALNLIIDHFPPQAEDFREWPACALLFSHALEVIRHAERLELALDKAAALLCSVGVYEGKRGQSESGRVYLERSLALEEKTNGPNHVNVAIRANDLADVLLDLDQLDKAVALLERALKIDKQARGANHPFVAIRLSNLGRALLKKKELTTALRHAKRALKIDEKALGPRTHRVSIDADLIGLILFEMNDFPGALEYARRALEIEIEVRGPCHSDVASRYHNLANIVTMQGHLAAAFLYYRQAIVIYQDTLPPDHPYMKVAVQSLMDLAPYLRKALSDHKGNPNGPNGQADPKLIAEIEAFLKAVALSDSDSTR